MRIEQDNISRQCKHIPKKFEIITKLKQEHHKVFMT